MPAWTKLNAFRGEQRLPPISMPGSNTYLDKARVVEGLTSAFEFVEIVNVAGTCFVATCVRKARLAASLGDPVDVADPAHRWNRWWAAAPAWGDYGT